MSDVELEAAIAAEEQTRATLEAATRERGRLDDERKRQARSELDSLLGRRQQLVERIAELETHLSQCASRSQAIVDETSAVKARIQRLKGA